MSYHSVTADQLGFSGVSLLPDSPVSKTRSITPVTTPTTSITPIRILSSEPEGIAADSRHLGQAKRNEYSALETQTRPHITLKLEQILERLVDAYVRQDLRGLPVEERREREAFIAYLKEDPPTLSLLESAQVAASIHPKEGHVLAHVGLLHAIAQNIQYEPCWDTVAVVLGHEIGHILFRNRYESEGLADRVIERHHKEDFCDRFGLVIADLAEYSVCFATFSFLGQAEVSIQSDNQGLISSHPNSYRREENFNNLKRNRLWNNYSEDPRAPFKANELEEISRTVRICELMDPAKRDSRTVEGVTYQCYGAVLPYVTAMAARYYGSIGRDLFLNWASSPVNFERNNPEVAANLEIFLAAPSFEPGKTFRELTIEWYPRFTQADGSGLRISLEDYQHLIFARALNETLRELQDFRYSHSRSRENKLFLSALSRSESERESALACVHTIIEGSEIPDQVKSVLDSSFRRVCSGEYQAQRISLSELNEILTTLPHPGLLNPELSGKVTVLKSFHDYFGAGLADDLMEHLLFAAPTDIELAVDCFSTLSGDYVTEGSRNRAIYKDHILKVKQIEESNGKLAPKIEQLLANGDRATVKAMLDVSSPFTEKAILSDAACARILFEHGFTQECYGLCIQLAKEFGLSGIQAKLEYCPDAQVPNWIRVLRAHQNWLSKEAAGDFLSVIELANKRVDEASPALSERVTSRATLNDLRRAVVINQAAPAGEILIDYSTRKFRVTDFDSINLLLSRDPEFQVTIFNQASWQADFELLSESQLIQLLNTATARPLELKTNVHIVASELLKKRGVLVEAPQNYSTSLSNASVIFDSTGEIRCTSGDAFFSNSEPSHGKIEARLKLNSFTNEELVVFCKATTSTAQSNIIAVLWERTQKGNGPEPQAYLALEPYLDSKNSVVYSRLGSGLMSEAYAFKMVSNRDLAHALYFATPEGLELVKQTSTELLKWVESNWTTPSTMRDLFLLQHFRPRFGDFDLGMQQRLLGLFKDSARSFELQAQSLETHPIPDGPLDHRIKHLVSIVRDPSNWRDALLEKELGRAPFRLSEFQTVAHYYCAYSEASARTSSIIQGTLGAAVDKMSPKDKAQTLRWFLRTVEEPPGALYQAASEGHFSTYHLRQMIADPQSRTEIFSALFAGNNGLFASGNRTELDTILDDIVAPMFRDRWAQGAQAQVQGAAWELTKGIFHECSSARKLRVLEALYSASENSAGFEDRALALLGAYGKEGVKFLQIISEQPWVKQNLPDLHRAAERAKYFINPLPYYEAAIAISNNHALAARDPLIEERRASASIGGLFRARVDDRTRALKVKRVEVNKELNADEQEMNRLMQAIERPLCSIFNLDRIPNYVPRVFGSLRKEVQFPEEQANLVRLNAALSAQHDPAMAAKAPLADSEFSDANVLDLDWMNGEALGRQLNRHSVQEQTKMYAGLQRIYLGAMLRGIGHGDPHGFNIQMESSTQSQWLDGGSCFNVAREDFGLVFNLVTTLSNPNLTVEQLHKLWGLILPNEVSSQNQAQLSSAEIELTECPSSERPIRMLNLFDRLPGYEVPEIVAELVNASMRAQWLMKPYEENKIFYLKLMADVAPEQVTGRHKVALLALRVKDWLTSKLV